MTIIHLHTVHELARRTGAFDWEVRKDIQDGALTARRLGPFVHVLDEDLDRWLIDWGADWAPKLR